MIRFDLFVLIYTFSSFNGMKHNLPQKFRFVSIQVGQRFLSVAVNSSNISSNFRLSRQWEFYLSCTRTQCSVARHTLYTIKSVNTIFSRRFQGTIYSINFIFSRYPCSASRFNHQNGWSSSDFFLSLSA